MSRSWCSQCRGLPLHNGSLPQLYGHSTAVQNTLGGWEVATIAQASSGSALTVFTGAISGLTNRVSGTGQNSNQRPNVIDSEPCRASGGAAEQWLNPAKWTLTDFALGTFGNSPRGVCHGPSFFQVDLAFYKNFQITDRFKAQVRFEMFNAFNRANFISVNTSLNPTSTTLDSGSASTATRITDFTPPPASARPRRPAPPASRTSV